MYFFPNHFISFIFYLGRRVVVLSLDGAISHLPQLGVLKQSISKWFPAWVFLCSLRDCARFMCSSIANICRDNVFTMHSRSNNILCVENHPTNYSVQMKKEETRKTRFCEASWGRTWPFKKQNCNGKSRGFLPLSGHMTLQSLMTFQFLIKYERDFFVKA